jgi:hypothetical protein
MVRRASNLRRRALITSWVASFAFGCAAPQQPSEGKRASTPAAATAEPERGVLGFVYEGRDTTVIEEYTRTATALEGIVRPQGTGAKFGWARYRVEFSPARDAERAVLELGRRGDESKPVRTWTAMIGGGEVIETSSDGRTRRVPISGSVVPLFPPSMAMFQEAIRRTHPLSSTRARADVQIFPLASNAEPHTVTVQWIARDTAAVSYHGGPRTHYAVDLSGRVLSVIDPRDGRNRLVRLR